MIRALMLAEPFGYGPTGSLLDVRQQLHGMPCRWRFAGPSYARKIIDETLFEGCTFSDRPWREEPALLPELDWADVVFSGTEFSVCDTIERAGKRLIVIDPLVWWLHTVPAVFSPTMIYLCQNFIGVRERLALLPPSIRERFFITPPTGGGRPLPQSLGARDHLLVNLGGLMNPLHEAADYPRLVLGCLRKALDSAPPMKVVITGNAGAISRLSAENFDPRLSFGTLHHEQMLAAMGRARLLLTAPGLNSAMEGLRMGVPTAFLPAMSGSQSAQLAVFQQAGLTLTAMDLGSLTGPPERWRAPCFEQTDAEETKIMLELERLLADTEVRRAVVNGLTRIVGAGDEDLRALQAKQKLFVASLTEAEGVRTIREILLSEGVFPREQH